MINSLTIKFRHIRSLAKFSPFDTSTEAGRSNERHRRIFLTAVASMLAKGVMMGTMLISIPLTLHYLGAERFGLWMTISSVIAMLGFADLGMGNGLLNAVSEAHGKDDHADIRRYISSAFVILSAIALFLLLVFSLAYPLVEWAAFFNVKSPLAMQEAGSAVAVFMLCFALNIPAGIVQRAQMGLQMGFVANLWQMAGSISGLLAVLLVIHFEMGLPWLVGALAGVPVVATCLNGVIFFGHTKPELLPEIKSVCVAAMKKIAHTGALFLVLQLAVSLAYSSDNFVISRIMGAEAVTQFVLPDTMFSVIPVLLGMMLKPLWPAYGEAVSRGDGEWIKKSFARSLKIALTLSAVSALLLVVFADGILRIWTGHDVSPPLPLLLGLGVWKILEGWGIAVAIFLNGANIVRLQAILATMMALTAITLKFVLVQYLGIAGVVWATVIAYSLITFVPLSFMLPGYLNGLGKKGNQP